MPASKAKSHALTVTLKQALGLPANAPAPSTRFDTLLSKVPGGRASVLATCASSTDPTLAPVMALYRSLTYNEKRRVSLDLLIQAARVTHPELDPPAVLGALVAELTRVSVSVTAMVASIEAPNTMKAVALRSRSMLDGHNDAKLLLQTVGVAPVPKTSITHITAGSIDARRQQSNVQVNLPRLEDITRMVPSDKVRPADGPPDITVAPEPEPEEEEVLDL
jgi:hypothetical protein